MSEEDYKESYRKEIDYWRIQYSNLQEEIERLNNILKEVREYANKYDDKIQKDILQILNKGE